MTGAEFRRLCLHSAMIHTYRRRLIIYIFAAWFAMVAGMESIIFWYAMWLSLPLTMTMFMVMITCIIAAIRNGILLYDEKQMLKIEESKRR